MLNGQVSRAIVSATIGSKDKLVSGITKQVENLTGVSLAPAASAERQRIKDNAASHETTSTYTTTTVSRDMPVASSSGREVIYNDQSTVLKEGDSGYIKETVKITTPDGQTTVSKREVPYS